MRFFNKYKRTVIYFIVTWRWTILNVVFKKRKKGKYIKSSQKEPWLMCLRIVSTKCVNRMKARAIRPLCWPPPNKFISIRESVRLQRRWNNIDNILDTLASNEIQFIEKRNMVYRIREIHVQLEKVCGCKEHWQHSWHSCFRRNTIYRKEKYSVQNLRNKSLREMTEVFVIFLYNFSFSIRWKIWFYANAENIEKKSMHWKEIGETDGAQILMALLCIEYSTSLPLTPTLIFKDKQTQRQTQRQRQRQHIYSLLSLL